ncbi:MAG: histidine phosphatase family protein [Gammaproteobacteria bacterium]|nr:histidine phosphatase family protein [Gammaproteobacteria bacterium]
MNATTGLRELLILRHAKSDHSDPTLADFDRPLSERGREDAHKIGHWITQQQLLPDVIVTSPSKRTLQTIRRARSHFDSDHTIHCIEHQDVYESDSNTLLSVLSQLPVASRILLVGHNPGLETLLTYLTEDPRLQQEVKLFPTCALAQLVLPADWSQLSPGCAKLINLWQVKALPLSTD